VVKKVVKVFVRSRVEKRAKQGVKRLYTPTVNAKGHKAQPQKGVSKIRLGGATNTGFHGKNQRGVNTFRRTKKTGKM